jgi:membrane protease YdiL (CAAX protease family)
MEVVPMDSILDRNRGLFFDAGRAKRLPNGLLATAVLVLNVMLSFVIVTVVVTIAAGDAAREAMLDQPTPSGFTIPFLLIVGMLTLWLALYERRALTTIGLAQEGFPREILTGAMVGLFMVSGTIGLMALFGCVGFETDAVRLHGRAAVGSVCLMLAVFLVQAGSEEILLRGWYLQVLGARHSPWAGILISSAAFAAMHAPTHPVAVLNLLLFGLFACFYCLRQGSVWGAWGWHATWNWTQGNLFGMGLSGHETWGGALLNLEARGPSVLSGGEYGPEASLFNTLFLLGGIAVVLAWWPPRKSHVTLPNTRCS